MNMDDKLAELKKAIQELENEIESEVMVGGEKIRYPGNTPVPPVDPDPPTK